MAFFSKKFFIAALICRSLLAAEEPPSLSLNSDEDFLSSAKVKSHFLYVAGGINPFPTISLGYRKLYSSFGSDFSISVSALPIFTYSSGVFPFPGAVYKQLFFAKKSSNGMDPEKFLFYGGLDVGFYPFAVNGGGLIGWQFNRKARSDFCEIGINPFLYSNGLSLLPLGSLTYGFMF